MDTAISTFCKALSSFLRHVDTASRTLSDSIQRRPIPLDSAASAFLQSLDRRVSSTSSDLELLNSMAFATVSFEELLGHCNEVHKTNLKYISDLQERMVGFGYVPEVDAEDGEGEGNPDIDSKILNPGDGVERLDLACGSVSAVRSSRKQLDDNSLFEDSISLRNLGFSDACLATLASEDDEYLASPRRVSERFMSNGVGRPHEKTTESQSSENGLSAQDGSAREAMLNATKDDYDNLPSYMKSLASWEEAVVKLNVYFSKGRDEESKAFKQDDVETIGLGRKGRSYLLLLLRMNQLAVETIDGEMPVYECHACLETCRWKNVYSMILASMTPALLILLSH
ncbi:uncharacterized protein [Typha angustifolia]|uniref:uncharacterized protein isoform X2 n=1 Tax=Typha angustifolia TaxID=59011 RepID=UPI003C2B619F